VVRSQGRSGAAPGSPQIPAAAAGHGNVQFPVGAAVTIADLDGDPHLLLRRLREREPVSWLPVLGGWLVTRRDLALRVLSDSETFTVDDPRFSTARVVGPSMLSLDGPEHGRHRDPFAQAFRVTAVRSRLEAFVEAAAVRLVTDLRPAGSAELRRSVAGPLAVAVVAEVLGLDDTEPAIVLSWYDAIVAAVSALAADPGGAAGPAAAGSPAVAGECGGSPAVAGSAAFSLLRASLEAAIGRQGSSSLLAAAAADGGLTTSEVVSNAAVMMFGGIETTEGMIANAILHLLGHPDQLRLVLADDALIPNAIEESLRLEPAAAVVDRYCTAGVRIGDADIRQGDLVTVSLTGANRDPAFFDDPDRFDVRRDNARLGLAFARGPHFCPGAQLARLEAQAAIRALLTRLPGLRLDPQRDDPQRDDPQRDDPQRDDPQRDDPQRAGAPQPGSAPAGSAPAGSARGLVFRKPPALHARWDIPSG
jgi:cytochrome P450